MTINVLSAGLVALALALPLAGGASAKTDSDWMRDHWAMRHTHQTAAQTSQNACDPGQAVRAGGAPDICPSANLKITLHGTHL